MTSASRAPGTPRERRRILYVTTREVRYPRNSTLIRALEHFGAVRVIAPGGSGQGFDRRLAYLWGLAHVVVRLVMRAMARRDDTLVLGFLAQPLAAIAGPLWRGRLVADALVSVYDTVCHDKRLARERSFMGRAAWWLDAHLVRRADVLLFDTEQHRDYFRTFARAALPPSLVVRVGARPMKRAGAPRERSDRFHVLFAGSFIPLQGVRTIVEAARLLRDEPIAFTLVGSGQELPEALEIAKRCDLRSVKFIGWVDLDTLDDWYQRADVILGIFGPTAKTQRVIPNKVFEALAIGQPVITGDTPAIRELLVPDRDVICCAVNDPEALAAAIRWASRHRDRLREIGLAGQRAFERYASDAAIVEALRPAFESSAHDRCA
ncbi:MAG TPA: glycosyltransferase [Vicinamibacterales bacterium]|nr:glycosyltransferase [Vicinamibacterales bacterium]